MLETFISDTNTRWQTLTPLTGASFINDCLLQLQPLLHVNNPLLQFALRWHHASCSGHCLLFFIFIIITSRPELSRRPDILQDEFWRLTCNMPWKSSAIAIFKFSSSVETYLRWGGKSFWHLCTKFLRESDSKRIVYIGLHLPKLWSKVKCIIFLTQQCIDKHSTRQLGV